MSKTRPTFRFTDEDEQEIKNLAAFLTERDKRPCSRAQAVKIAVRHMSQRLAEEKAGRKRKRKKGSDDT